MDFTVTYTLAILLAALAVPLSINVTLQRIRVGKEMGELTAAAFGPHPDPRLTAAMRAHGNLMEYAPFALVLIGLAEFAGAQGTWIWTIALAFAGGRWLHAFAMLTNPYPPMLRGVAMLTTYLSMLAPAIFLAFTLTRAG
ncbi:MAPEG family protein [Yoonia sp. BS5-3]|uniref:MAPEG family protein n=1 Tax=Yoonia phaeophyticola TaxID=3137369 RepID=A0ABZ2UYZ9_9RHOB